MSYLKLAWKILSSKPVLFGSVALFAFFFFQEWSAHRATAKLRAEHYVTVTTKEAMTWETTRYICAGGPVSIATGLSDSEIKRLAREHGLTLSERVEVAVPGEDRIVEVPIFTTVAGGRVRLLGRGEKVIEPAPWGAKALGGLDEEGDLFLDVKPTPEPFQERLAAWNWWIGGFYGLDEFSKTFGEQGHGLEVAGGMEWDWRRLGRWTIAPSAEAGISNEAGWQARVGVKLYRRQLPVNWRD